MLIFENKTLLERVLVCLCDIIPVMRTTIFHSGASYEMKCLFFLSMIFSYLFKTKQRIEDDRLYISTKY